MMYALIQLPRASDKRVIVETRHILEFEKYYAITKTQVWCYDDGEIKCKCIILRLSDSVEELEDPTLRVRKPKVKNPSGLDLSANDEDVDLLSVKRARKCKKQNLELSKKGRVNKILEAHKLDSNVNKMNATTVEVLAGDSLRDNEASDDSLFDPILESDTQKKKNDQKSPVRPNDDSPEAVNHDKEIIPDTMENESSREIYDRNSEQETQDFDMEERYNTIAAEKTTKRLLPPKENADPVTARKPVKLGVRAVTSQQIVIPQELIEQRQQLQMQQQRRLWEVRQQLQLQREQQQEQPRRRVLYSQNDFIEHDQFLFGDGRYISSASFREANNADTPSKFVTTMAHAVWKPAELKTKVVRVQRNTGDRKALTPRKIELLSYHFENFLEVRNYSPI